MTVRRKTKSVKLKISVNDRGELTCSDGFAANNVEVPAVGVDGSRIIIKASADSESSTVCWHDRRDVKEISNSKLSGLSWPEGPPTVGMRVRLDTYCRR